MSFKEAKEQNDKIYCKWATCGKPEAFDELNDSNRNLIRAYLEENPNAVGYKFNGGIVELKDNPLHNFCCDIIFDRSLVKELEKNKINPRNAMRVLNEKNSYCIVWS